MNPTLASGASRSYNNSFCGPGVAGPTGESDVLQQLNLPSGQFYTFGYDPVYGLVNSITYPTGATVAYTWGLNPQSEWKGDISNNSIGQVVQTNSACYYKYDWPAIQTRTVTFDGVTPAQERERSPNPMFYAVVVSGLCGLLRRAA